MGASRAHTIRRASDMHRMLRRCSSSTATAPRDQPQWLQQILNDSEPPPRRYAWTVNNLNPMHMQQARQARQASSQGDPSRRVFVMGLGNLGRLYATALGQLSDPPPITLVVHRRNLLEHWACNPGIEMTRYGQLERHSDFDVEWWTDEEPSAGLAQEVDKIPNLIIATKAQDAIVEVDRLRRYLSASSTILFVTNGMNRLWPPHGGTYTKHRYPDGSHPNFLQGITMHGVSSEGPFKSLHASPADVVVGPVQTHGDIPEYLTNLVTTAPILAGRAVSKAELWIQQLEKIVVNMTINPLTAVLRIRNGELFANKEDGTLEVIDQLLIEASRVLQALVKHESSKEIIQHSELSIDTLLQRFSVPPLRDIVHRAGERTKFSKSSMFQDVAAGKRTEIRDFNGWLVETAEMLDESLDVSSHKLLIDLIEQGVGLDKAELGRLLLPRTRSSVMNPR